MSERTLEASPGCAPPPGASDPPSASEARRRRFSLAARGGWWTAAGLLALSVALVYWAGTRPGFDPYGWLVWGHQTLQGTLDTNAAPSWKPLPYIFTVPYGLAGNFQLRLWMITSTAVSLSGVVFAARIAHKLTGAAPERRWAAIAAGAFAGVALLGIQNYAHYVLSSQSDPMIVALCLGAIDCHLERRPRAAIVLGTLAALGRPEVWPFLGLYSIWAFVKVPRARWLLIAAGALILLLWFGIPALTSRTPFVAASNALKSGRRLHGNLVFGTVGRFLSINELPVELAALLAVAIAALRRERTTLVLAAGIVGWVAIEIGFSLHGWPGLARYMFEAGGVLVVLAGAGVGRLLSWPSGRPEGGSPARAGLTMPTWAGPAVVAVLVASLVPVAISHARDEHRDLNQQRRRTTEINRLAPVIGGLGGASRLRGCGEPVTRLAYQTTLAFALGENVSKVGFKYGPSIAHGNPLILFTPFPAGIGWTVKAVHQTRPACRSLPH